MPATYADGGLRAYLDALPGNTGFLAIEAGVQAQGRAVVKQTKINASAVIKEPSIFDGLIDSFKLRKTTQRTRAKTPVGQAMSLFQMVAERPAGSHFHFLEFGFTARDGRFIPGKPYIEPAIEGTIQEQKHVFDKTVRKKSDQLAEKFKRGGFTQREKRYLNA